MPWNNSLRGRKTSSAHRKRQMVTRPHRHSFRKSRSVGRPAAETKRIVDLLKRAQSKKRSVMWRTNGATSIFSCGHRFRCTFIRFPPYIQHVNYVVIKPFARSGPDVFSKKINVLGFSKKKKKVTFWPLSKECSR